jgi:hypothetical protein
MQLNKMELQNLRELIGSHQTTGKKLRSYAQQCQDPQVKQLLQQGANDADNTTTKLMSFLQ